MEIIAAAQDSDGQAAAGPYYSVAQTSFASLIDRSHRISSVYNLANVPSAVWIDERGQIVRLDSGAFIKELSFSGVTVGSDHYVPALRDWVKRGAASQFVVPPKDLAKKLNLRSADEALADVNFQLGAYFHNEGDTQRANRYWNRAQKLNPDNWNYHRQDWSFSDWEASSKFILKFLGRALLGKDYYEPFELPEATSSIQ